MNIRFFYSIISFFSIPTIWRYFFVQYAKVFALSLLGFLILILSNQLDSFARFISQGTSFPLAILFILYQIPSAMQIALPIASVIASYFLMQKISQNRGLAALRASGMSLRDIMQPLFLISLLLATSTFSMLYNFSAKSHFAAKKLAYDQSSLNPLHILHNAKLLEAKGMSIEMDGSLHRDGETKNLLMAIANKNSKKASLFIAKKLYVDGETIRGKNVSLLTSAPSDKESGYNHLALENSKESSFLLQDVRKALTGKRLKKSDEDLPLAQLIAKKRYLEKRGTTKKKITKIQRAKCINELVKRLSIALSIISCTLLGAAFGATTLPSTSKKRLFILLGCMAFFLISFLGAKAVERNIFLSSLFLLLPHPLFFYSGYKRLTLMQHQEMS